MATTAKTRTAYKRATSYELTCPECGATIPSPQGVGSQFWTLEEMDFAVPRVTICFDCKASVKIPKGEARE